VPQELPEPTMAEQQQPVVELAVDALVLGRSVPLAVWVVAEVLAVEPCRMWELDRASTSRRLLTSM